MLLLGLVLSALAAAPQPPLSDTFQINGPDAQVAGRVLDAATNMPMAGAHVVFALRGRSRLQAVTVKRSGARRAAMSWRPAVTRRDVTIVFGLSAPCRRRNRRAAKYQAA
jgi:hypothetical protein